MANQPSTTSDAMTQPCSCRRQSSKASNKASAWSATGLFVLALVSLPNRGAGLWGLGRGNVGLQQRTFDRQSIGSDDFDMDAVFDEVQEDQFWESVENTGMGVLEEEVANEKTREIFVKVAKGCSIGAQATLIMGGGALLFRLIPALLGHDPADEDEEDAFTSYLLPQPDNASGRAQLALPAATRGRQRLLTDGREKAAVQLADAADWGGHGAAGGGEAAAAGGACGTVVWKADGGRGIVAATGNGGVEEAEGEVIGDGEVVMDTTMRSTLRKVRRISRPFLEAMAVPLALLLVARLTLGNLLAKTIDPTLELLFGDEIIEMYSASEKVVNEVDMPFPKDADDVPGRRKMKKTAVQQLPRPEG